MNGIAPHGIRFGRIAATLPVRDIRNRIDVRQAL